MKQNLLLVSACMMLTASSALAAATWVNPKDTPVTPVFDGSSTYLLYNPDVKGFIVAGNDWSTHACLAKEDSIPVGYYFRFTTVNGSDETVIAEDSCLSKSGAWMKMFNDGAADNTYMDHGSQSPKEKTYWTFSKIEGTDYYHIENVNFKNNNTDKAYYLGVDQSLTPGSTGAYSLYLLPAGGDGFTRWYFVSGASMQAYEYSFKLAESLTEILETYPDINVDDEMAVYNNTSSTLAQLQAAVNSLKKKIVQYEAQIAEQTATFKDPVILTKFIENSTFDVIGDFHGWSGTAFAAGGSKDKCAEHHQESFDTYQDIDGLPNGVYTVNVDGFYRAGDIPGDYLAERNQNTFNSKLYAGNITADTMYVAQTNMMHLFHGIEAGNSDLGGSKYIADGATYWVPNTMAEFVKFNEAGYYKTNKVMIAVSEGKIRIGVKNETTLGWSIFDNFGLAYHGKGADAYAALLEDYKANVALDKDLLCSASLRSDYESVLAAATASNFEEYLAALEAIAAQKVIIDENVAAWAKLKVVVDECNIVVNDPKFINVKEAADLGFAIGDANTALEELNLTTEEVLAMIEDLSTQLALVNSQTPPGTDVSHKIINSDFSANTNGDAWYGWTREAANGGNVRVSVADKCAEAWNNAGFDIYQIIRDLPVGMYEVSSQGFYRYGRDQAWAAYFNEVGTPRPEAERPAIPTFVYLNDAKTPMNSVFDFQSLVTDSLYDVNATHENKTDYVKDKLPNEVTGDEGIYAYPNDMASAGRAFDIGAYSKSSWGLVAHDGDSIRIGVKGSSNQAGDSWCIFTRFKLIYQGFPVDRILAELEANIDNVNLDVIKEKNAFTKQFIDKDLAEEVNALYTTANGMINEVKTNGVGQEVTAQGMFDVLAQIYAIGDRIDASIEVFKNFNTKVTDLATAYETYAEAIPANRTVVYDFIMQVNANLSANAYTTETVEVALAEVKRLNKLITIPVGIVEGSDVNPINLTGCIENADFEESDNLVGWNDTGVVNFQGQTNSDFGKSGNRYAERWHENGTLHLSQTIENLNLPAGTYGITALTHCSTGDGVLYANGAETAITNLDAPKAPAVDTVFVTIEENQPITFGVKATLTDKTWCCVDRFQFFYYGTESNHSSAIEEVFGGEALKVEYLDLNGRKSGALKQGINIVRRTDANGNVKVYKVVVR